jgi:hypothetical protein
VCILYPYHATGPLGWERGGRDTLLSNDSHIFAMPRCKRDNTAINTDLVPYTQYHHSQATELPKKYSNISFETHSDPLELIPINNPGPKIPENVDSSDPETLFQLFFDDNVLDQLVSCTNACAERTREASQSSSQSSSVTELIRNTIT